MSGGTPVWVNPAAVSVPVTTVFGRIGDITAQAGDYTTTQVTEGTNLYFTNTRADARVTSLFPSLFDTRLATKTTTDITEGTNLYYTQGRFDTAFSAKNTDNLTEGSTNLYYTTARVNSAFDTRLATKTTDNLSE